MLCSCFCKLGKFRNSQELIFSCCAQSKNIFIIPIKLYWCSLFLPSILSFHLHLKNSNVHIYSLYIVIVFASRIIIQQHLDHPHCECVIVLYLFALSMYYTSPQVSYFYSATSFLVCGITTIIIAFFSRRMHANYTWIHVQWRKLE